MTSSRFLPSTSLSLRAWCSSPSLSFLSDIFLSRQSVQPKQLHEIHAVLGLEGSQSCLGLLPNFLLGNVNRRKLRLISWLTHFTNSSKDPNFSMALTASSASLWKYAMLTLWSLVCLNMLDSTHS